MIIDEPIVSVVVETSTWHQDENIGLRDLLDSLARQSLASDRMQLILVLAPEVRERWQSIAADFSEVEVLELSTSATYYLAKGEGARRARAEIVAFLDSDNSVGELWAEEITRPFRTNPEILAVQGRTRFRDAFLSRLWDALWWDRAFEAEGLIDRIYGSNNLAFRKDFLARSFSPDSREIRGIWERHMTARVKAAGGLIWLNPRAQMRHDFEPALGNQIHRALCRGTQIIARRRHAPLSSEGLQRRLLPLLPFLGMPFLLLKDLWRVTVRTRRMDLSAWELIRVPGYWLALLPLEFFVWLGLLFGAITGRGIPPP